jgi:ABC-type glycerol-3-phosphate transport system substrate-binding protein
MRILAGRTLLAGALIGSLLLLGTPSFAAEPVKITWWHAMSGQLGEALDQVVARFK